MVVVGSDCQEPRSGKQALRLAKHREQSIELTDGQGRPDAVRITISVECNRFKGAQAV